MRTEPVVEGRVTSVGDPGRGDGVDVGDKRGPVVVEEEARPVELELAVALGARIEVPAVGRTSQGGVAEVGGERASRSEEIDIWPGITVVIEYPDPDGLGTRRTETHALPNLPPRRTALVDREVPVRAEHEDLRHRISGTVGNPDAMRGSPDRGAFDEPVEARTCPHIERAIGPKHPQVANSIPVAVAAGHRRHRCRRDRGLNDRHVLVLSPPGGDRHDERLTRVTHDHQILAAVAVDVCQHPGRSGVEIDPGHHPPADRAFLPAGGAGRHLHHGPVPVGAKSDHVGCPVAVAVGDGHLAPAGGQDCRAVDGGGLELPGIERCPRREGRARRQCGGADPGEVHRVLAVFPVPAPAEPGIPPYLDEPGRHVGDHRAVGPVRVLGGVDVDGQSEGVAADPVVASDRTGGEGDGIADRVAQPLGGGGIEGGGHLLERRMGQPVDVHAPPAGSGHRPPHQLVADVADAPAEVAPEGAEDQLRVGEEPAAGGDRRSGERGGAPR